MFLIVAAAISVFNLVKTGFANGGGDFIIGICGAFLISVILYPIVKGIATVRGAIDKIPYAPPVTADTLPAEQILGGSSEEPPVAPACSTWHSPNVLLCPCGPY